MKHAKRDVHFGQLRRRVVPNPIWTPTHLLATMKNAHGEITIDGFHDAIEAPTPEEREAAARLPLDLDEVKRSLGLAPRLDEPAEDRAFYDVAVLPADLDD